MSRSDPFGCAVAGVPAAELPIVGRDLQNAYAEYEWLLAHCDDGLTWGFREGSVWHVASDHDLATEPKAGNLQQLRLFGENCELLVWRLAGGFRGRILRDASSEGLNAWEKPKDESRILVGDRLLEKPRGGFSIVGDAHGSRHAFPMECTENDFEDGRHPLRLKVRHYFARAARARDRQPDTGVVRIAASRLVSIGKE